MIDYLKLPLVCGMIIQSAQEDRHHVKPGLGHEKQMKEFVYQSVSVLSMLLSTPLCSPVMKVRLKSNDSMVKPGVVSGRTKSIVRFKF